MGKKKRGAEKPQVKAEYNLNKSENESYKKKSSRRLGNALAVEKKSCKKELFK